MGLNQQPRIRLATLPTPLQFAPNLTRVMGGPRIYLKRDDLTGLAFGGNKTRKLEYLVADAQAIGATHLITVGGTQSNHVRQTAAAARIAGMECVLVLNTSVDDPPLAGNLLIDRILGADVRFVRSADARATTMEEVGADLRDQGHIPYLIPGGGSNGVGAIGYVAAILELNHQLWEQGLRPSALYFAAGGGGTHGGAALGGALYGSDYRIIGVMIEDTAAEGVERAWSIADAAAQRLGMSNPLRRSDILCDDAHVGPGYGIPTAECLDAIRLLARTEGVLLDSVYTAKAFAGLLADIRAGRYTPDESVVFLHTGGTPALFAMTDILGPVIA